MKSNFRVLVSLETLFKNKTKQHQEQQKPQRIFPSVQGMDFPEGDTYLHHI